MEFDEAMMRCTCPPTHYYTINYPEGSTGTDANSGWTMPDCCVDTENMCDDMSICDGPEDEFMPPACCDDGDNPCEDMSVCDSD